VTIAVAVAVIVVAFAQLIAVVLWIKPRKLAALWSRPRPNPKPRAVAPELPALLAPELPALLAPLLEEIARLRHEIHDERLARAAGLAAERFAGLRAMRLAAGMSTPPLLDVVTEGDPGSMEIAPPHSALRRLHTVNSPPLSPLAFPESLIGSEDIPDEVASVIGPGSGLGPEDDTPAQGTRSIRARKPR
jgi:hypothetical protein